MARLPLCAPFVRQSERDAIYRQAVDVLAARGLVYGCDCSRRGSRLAPRGTRHRRTAVVPLNLYSAAAASGTAADERRRLARADDARRGVLRRRAARPQAQDPSVQCGDLLIRDRLGNWTYQFAASVDDVRQGIDLVIRGIDLLPSTGRQIRLARLLGRETPAAFLHHPLIMKSPEQKLSKSDGDTGVQELRAGGWTPEQVKDAARSSQAGSFRL